jgi:hypothetical protein
MRVARVLLIVSPIFLAACGIVAGLDGYELDQNVAAGDASGSGQKTDGSVSNADGATSGGGTDGGFAVRDGSQVVEASIPLSDAGGDATEDTGPPIMNCTLTQNGNHCDQDANACCSGICNEGHTCTSNPCIKPPGSGCTNDLSVQLGYVSAKDNCCGNTFCSPNDMVADKGTCQPCVLNNAQTPARAVNLPVVGTTQVIYVHACCSGNFPDQNGYCH